jgi:hypothetical protein
MHAGMHFTLQCYQSASGQSASGQSASGQSASGQSVSGQSVSGHSASGQSASGQSARGRTLSFSPRGPLVYSRNTLENTLPRNRAVHVTNPGLECAR